MYNFILKLGAFILRHSFYIFVSTGYILYFILLYIVLYFYFIFFFLFIIFISQLCNRVKALKNFCFSTKLEPLPFAMASRNLPRDFVRRFIELLTVSLMNNSIRNRNIFVDIFVPLRKTDGTTYIQKYSDLNSFLSKLNILQLSYGDYHCVKSQSSVKSLIFPRKKQKLVLFSQQLHTLCA